MKNAVKNSAILVLVIIALAQTGRLWFGITTSHSLLFALSSVISNAPDDYAEKTYLAAPFRIITKAPSGKYSIIYNDLDASAVKRNADAALLEFFSSGSFVGEANIDWVKVLARDCLIYDYPFAVPADVFAECFLKNPNTVKAQASRLTDNVRSIDYIAFIPASAELPADITVLFIDAGRQKTYEYLIKAKKSMADNPLIYTEDGTSTIRFISTAEAGLTASNINAFIPDIPKEGLRYYPVTAEDPYISPDGVKTLKSVENGIRALFADSPINQAIPDDVSYRYANESIVVRYNLTTDIIEYSNYSSVNRQNDNGVVPNFSSAVRFIKNDPNIKNDFYLVSYSLFDDAYTFCFDYTVAGFPLILADSVKQETGINCAIEVTTQYQKVVKYKRVACVFTADTEDYETEALTFGDFFDAAYSSETNTDLNSTAETVKFGYTYDRNTLLFLNWALR